MSIEERLERINSHSTFFINTENLTIHGSKQGHNAIPNSSPVNEQIIQPPSNLIPPDHFEVEDIELKSKRFWRTRTAIPKSCKSFFVYIKPANTSKGTRVILLYQPPFYALYDETGPELEMIPSRARFYLEGRFMFIVVDGVKRSFTIKTDLEEFYEIINNGSDDIIYQFFVCIRLNNHLPFVTHLTNPYYNRTMYSKRFLLIFTIFPPESLHPDFMDSWVRAVDPNLADVFDFIIQKEFSQLELPIYNFPNNFLSKAINAVFEADDSFSSFKDTLIKAKRIIESFYGIIDFSNFNDRSKMVLHLIYYNAERAFPRGDVAEKIVSSVIVKNVCDNLRKIGQEKKSDLLLPASSIEKSTAPQCLVDKYKALISNFKKQPASYTPAKCGTYTFEAFASCMKVAAANMKYIIQHFNDYCAEIPPDAEIY